MNYTSFKLYLSVISDAIRNMENELNEKIDFNNIRGRLLFTAAQDVGAIRKGNAAHLQMLKEYNKAASLFGGIKLGEDNNWSVAWLSTLLYKCDNLIDKVCCQTHEFYQYLSLIQRENMSNDLQELAKAQMGDIVFINTPSRNCANAGLVITMEGSTLYSIRGIDSSRLTICKESMTKDNFYGLFRLDI